MGLETNIEQNENISEKIENGVQYEIYNMQYEKYSILSIKSSQISFPGCGGIFMSVHGPSYYNTSRIVHFKLDYLCIHNTFVLYVFVFVLYICICVFE